MLKDLKTEKIISQDFAEIDSEERLSKLVPYFKGTRDIVIVKNKDVYAGVISKKDLIRSTAKPSSTKVKNIVRRCPKISKGTNLLEVSRLMIENNMSHLPVFENEKIVGVVKIDDLLREVLSQKPSFKAKDVMTSNLVCLEPSDSVTKALITCREHNISRIPIISKDKLVGLVSLHDIITPKLLGPVEGLTTHDLIAEKNSIFDMNLENIMNKEVYTVTENMTANDLIKKMFEKNISSLIVVEYEKPVGVLTKKDLLQQALYESEEADKEIIIQIISKVDINKKAIIQEIKDFAKKNEEDLGPGYINAHITKHKETFKDQNLLHCRLRIRCKQQYDVSSEGYGEEYLMKEAFRKLKHQMYKEGKKKVSPEEVYEYTNTGAL